MLHLSTLFQLIISLNSLERPSNYSINQNQLNTGLNQPTSLIRYYALQLKNCMTCLTRQMYPRYYKMGLYTALVLYYRIRTIELR